MRGASLIRAAKGPCETIALKAEKEGGRKAETANARSMCSSSLVCVSVSSPATPGHFKNAAEFMHSGAERDKATYTPSPCYED
jgi:hypothetical protein